MSEQKPRRRGEEVEIYAALMFTLEIVHVSRQSFTASLGFMSDCVAFVHVNTRTKSCFFRSSK